VSTTDLEGGRSRLQPGDRPSSHHGYDPNQPRVPAGHRDGGQWTATPGGSAPATAHREAIIDRSQQEAWGSYVNTYRPDGTLAEQRVFNRDGGRIVSEFNGPDSPGDWEERHTVVLSDGSKVTFQNSGETQQIYDADGRLIGAAVWTEDGPQSLPIGELAFLAPTVGAGAGLAARLGPAAVRAITAAGWVLYTWLSSRRDRDRSAVFAFKAGKYENRGTKEQPEVVFVGRLTRDEVSEVCKQLVDVQERTDAAVAKVREDADYEGPAEFGTKVHKVVAAGIGKKNRNYKAEVSGFKSKDADIQYGAQGSTRIDVYEHPPDSSTVCVYDLKTGERGLSSPRMTELAQTAQRLFGRDPKYILVVEVRPGQQ
jgi:hypothetical protein